MSQSVTVAETAAAELYDRHAGRLFAYCYARVGTRDLAEWAVGATLDRAHAALANGGLPEHELDWLLRTADKFCAPRLRLRDGALADPGALVLDDWEGLTFDQIASRIEASRAALERARGELSPWRRVLGALNVGSLVSWLKATLTGASAVKTAAAVVAITGAAVVVGTPVGDRLHDAVRPPSKPAKPATASNGSHASPPGQSRAGRAATASNARARGGGPVVAAGKAKAAAARAPRSASPGSAASPPASSSASAGTTAAATPTTSHSGAVGSSAPPASGDSTKSAPTASATVVPVPAEPTLPADTPPAGLPLPQPPPVPDPPSLPDPGAETPAPPALPAAPAVDLPSPPAAPTVPDAPKLPDPPQLP